MVMGARDDGVVMEERERKTQNQGKEMIVERKSKCELKGNLESRENRNEERRKWMT